MIGNILTPRVIEMLMVGAKHCIMTDFNTEKHTNLPNYSIFQLCGPEISSLWKNNVKRKFACHD